LFDSPLFWIIVIWWLLTTFLGARARRRRAAQAAQPAPKPKAAVPSEELRFAPEEEDLSRGIAHPPAAGEKEEVLEEATSGRTPPTEEYPTRARPEPASKPGMPWDDWARTLGIPLEIIPGAREPEEKEVLPTEEEAELPELEPAVSAEPLPEKAAIAQPDAVPPTPAGIRPLLPENVLTQLTPLQQAILMKEVLDRPRAFRRGIR
jgi:hypothetical protein